MLLTCLHNLSLKLSTILVVTWGFFVMGQSNQVNKISIEGNVGFTLKRDTNLLGVRGYLNFELAGRYMFSSIHGMKIDVGVNPNKNDFNLTSFTKTFLTRYSLQYVFDAGRAFKVEKYQPKISLLLHLGGGISTQRYNQSKLFSSWKSNLADERINLIIGLTPQYHYSERLEFHADLSMIGNLFQTFNQGFRWTDLTKRSLFGNYINLSLGVSYYIGKYDKHTDWKWKKKTINIDVPPPTKIENPPVVDYDLDDDLIPDSVDFCPEIAGIYDFEGCPKPEITNDCEYNLFPIFTFKPGKIVLQDSYNSDITFLINCLKSNPIKKIIIYGHTDEHRNEFYIENLGLNRAKQIRDKLVEKGVEENRIFVVGEGSKKANLEDSIRSKIPHNRIAFIKAISNNQNDLKSLKSGKYVQDLVFTIQIGSFKQEIVKHQFDKLGEIYISKSDEGNYRYNLLTFVSLFDAQEKLANLQKQGKFKDAFVTAYFLGEKITIAEAKKIQLQK